MARVHLEEAEKIPRIALCNALSKITNKINIKSSKRHCIHYILRLRQTDTLTDEIVNIIQDEEQKYLNHLKESYDASITWLTNNINNLVMNQIELDPWSHRFTKLRDVIPRDTCTSVLVELLGIDGSFVDKTACIILKEQNSEKKHRLQYKYKKWILDNHYTIYSLLAR